MAIQTQSKRVQTVQSSCMQVFWFELFHVFDTESRYDLFYSHDSLETVNDSLDTLKDS